MSCNYKLNGVDNLQITEVLNYIEDTPSDVRDTYKIEEILLNNDLAIREGNKLYLVDVEGTSEQIRVINQAASRFFGVAGNLIVQTKEGKFNKLDVDDNIMRLMFPIRGAQNTSIDVGVVEREQEYLEEDDAFSTEEDPAVTEAFARNQEANHIADLAVTNIQRQIDRLERREQTEKVKARTDELLILKRQLRNIKKGKEKISEYYDYIDYVMVLTQRARSIMETIEDEYAVSYKNMPNERRAEILKNVSDLRETLDAFYSDDRSRSMIDLVQNKIAGMRAINETEQDVKDEMLEMTVVAIKEMEELNKKYLEIGIPINADLLLEYAPMEVNEKLDAKIERLQKALDEGDMTIPYDGLQTDAEARQIMRETGFVQGLLPRQSTKDERKRRLLELNIKQLQRQKVGRESIIRELREAHFDTSAQSLYTDPLIYNSELSIRLFAQAVKTETFLSQQNTIDTKFEIEPAFMKFLEAKGSGQNNPAKIYEDMYEILEVPQIDKDTGERKIIRVLAFVQPHDMNKFRSAQNAFMTKAREQYNFPEDPSDYDDFFKSQEGRDYNAAIADWYEENTEEIPGAMDIIDNMLRERDNIQQAMYQAFKDGKEATGKELSYKYHSLEHEIKRVYRMNSKGRGKIIGRLTQPKMYDAKGTPLYANLKYANMPTASKEYYDVLVDVYKKHQHKVGVGSLTQNPWDDFSYVLPSSRKTAMDNMYQKGTKDALTDYWEFTKEGFTKAETDTEFGELVQANGERIKRVPRYFTNLVDENEISRDITNSIIKFVDMANRFEAKSKMMGVVNVMHDAVAARGVKIRTRTGNFLLDETARRLGYNIEREKLGKESNTFKALESFIDNAIYGESVRIRDKEDIDRKIAAAKTVSFVTGITAIARLGFNTLQASNQLLHDNTMGSSEAWAQQFYSYENMWKARQIVYMGGLSLEGIAPKFNKKSKLQQYLLMVNAMQEGGDFSKSTGTAAKRAFSKNIAMFQQRGAEFLSTAEKAVALALELEGKLKDKNGNVIKNKNGKPANLWDVLEKNKQGKLVVKSEVANFGKKELGQLAAKISGIVKRTNQLKDPGDKILAERMVFARPLALFRKYLPPAYRKRFGHQRGGYHIDTELGDLTEGYYVTALKTMASSVGMMRRGEFQEGMKYLAGRGKYATKEQRQNLARVLHEQIYIAMLGAIKMALGAMMDDDDEKDNWTYNFALYQTYRLQTELKAFQDYNEFFRIIENPTAASRLIRDSFELADATRDVGLYWLGYPIPEEDIFYQRRAGKFQPGDYKWTKEFLDVAPIASGIHKTRDPKKAVKYFQMIQD